MRVRQFGDRDDRDLLLLLGLGNRVRHAAVGWLVERLAADYRVRAVEIPDDRTDFGRDYRAPVERYAAGLGDDYRLLSHSAGSLVVAHLSTDRPGSTVAHGGGSRRVATLPSLECPWRPRAPGSTRRGRPRRRRRRHRPGDDLDPPAFVRAIRKAQAALGPGREDATVFCSLADGS